MKEKILELIKSDKKEDDEVLSQLLKWLKNKPDLINLTFTLDCTIFHLLVQHGRYSGLKKLLENYRPYALRVDRNNETIMHYAVKNNQDVRTVGILELLIQKIPELLNLKNVSGNTPLHQAVSSNQMWAILILVKNREVDKSASNKNMQSPLGLAGDNDLIRKALMHLDLKVVPELQLDARGRTPSRQEFYEKFPLLTRNGSSSTSSGSSSINSSASSSAREPLSISSDDVNTPVSLERLVSWTSVIKETKYNADDEKAVASMEPAMLFKKLLESYNKSPNFEKLKQQFCLLSKTVYLSNALEQQNTLFIIPKNRPALFSTLGQLYPLVQKEYKNHQDSITSFMTGYAETLVKEGLLQESTQFEKPKFPQLPAEKIMPTNAIWLLTLGMVEGGKTRKYDLPKIIHTALGLLGMYSFAEIIETLTYLYPFFDKNQKLITHYIICQLINYNSQEILDEKSPVNTHLKLFMQSNNRNSRGLGQLREKLTADLDKLIADIKRFNNNPLIKNFRLLSAWYRPIYSEKNSISFEQLIAMALTKEGKEREELIAYIGEALRIQTKAFYQQVPINEFYNNNWAQANYEKSAPFITAQTAYFNNLNNYFTKMILSQPSNNVTNAIQFLVQLAAVLCPLENDSYPDLNHIMLIVSVFNRAAISRLTPHFAALPDKDKAIIEEITSLVSQDKNSLWLREICHCRSTALPFLGTLQTDLTFAIDGNRSTISKTQSVEQPHKTELTGLLNKAEVSGRIFLEIRQIGAKVAFEVPHTQTDLPYFIMAKYQPLSDDELYNASCRIYVKKITVPNYRDKLYILCENIETNYLNRDVIPEGVWFEEKANKPKVEKVYSTSEFINKLVAMYEDEFDSVVAKLISANNPLPTKDALPEAETKGIKKTNSKDSKDSKKPKEPKPEPKNYRKTDWEKEFKEVDVTEIRSEIKALHDLLTLLERTIQKFIEVYNKKSESPKTSVEKINLPMQIQALKAVIDNLENPPVVKLRKLSLISANAADTIGDFHRSLQRVSIDPSIPADSSLSVSPEGDETSSRLAQEPQPIFSIRRRGSLIIREDSAIAAKNPEQGKGREASEEGKNNKGSIRKTFKGLTLFKGVIPNPAHNEESPHRASILPPKTSPSSDSVLTKK